MHITQKASRPTISCHAGGGTRVHSREFQCLRILGYRRRPVAATASLSPNRPKDAISGACPVPLTLFSYPIYGFGRQRARCSLPGTRSPLHGRLSTLTTLQPRKGFLAKAAEAWYLLPSLPESGGARQLSICSARSCGVSSSLFKKEILSDVP
jgi:hypothetical protein